MPKIKLFNKQAISPVIATILLLAVTVIIAVGTFQFVQDYTQNTMDSISNNQLLNTLNTKVVDANNQRAYIQTPYDNLNISKVLLSGIECTNNSGVSNSRVIELNLSSCSGNVTSFRPQLTIETNEGVLQLQVRELRAVSSSSSGGGSPSPNVSFNSNTTSIAFEGDVNLTWSSTNSNNCTATEDWSGSKGTSGSEVRSSLSTSQTYTLECSGDGGSTTESVTITVGSQDTTPDAFSFTNQSGVATSTPITSNSVTPTGYDGPLTATITGDGSPQLRINGGSWNTSANMSPSDSIELRLTSSSSSSTQFNVTLNLGSYSTIWSVETQAAAAFDSYCWLNDDKSSCESNFVVDGCGSGTVLDGGTGLCWQRDMGGSTMNWTDAQLNCSTSSTAGHSDWYLPSKEELMTLTDLSGSSPAIVGGNNNIFTNVVSNYYWTDTSRGYSSPSSYAWGVGFNNVAGITDSKASTYYATCVRRN